MPRAKTVASDDQRQPWHKLETPFERFESQPPPGVRLSWRARAALREVNQALEEYQRAA